MSKSAAVDAANIFVLTFCDLVARQQTAGAKLEAFDLVPPLLDIQLSPFRTPRQRFCFPMLLAQDAIAALRQFEAMSFVALLPLLFLGLSLTLTLAIGRAAVGAGRLAGSGSR